MASFALVIFEIVTVCLYTAWINDASKEPTALLNVVSSATYDSEVNVPVLIKHHQYHLAVVRKAYS